MSRRRIEFARMSSGSGRTGFFLSLTAPIDPTLRPASEVRRAQARLWLEGTVCVGYTTATEPNVPRRVAGLSAGAMAPVRQRHSTDDRPACGTLRAEAEPDATAPVAVADPAPASSSKMIAFCDDCGLLSEDCDCNT